MSHIWWDKLCKPKIWNPGCQVFVKENIACFDISVNNMWSYLLMKEGKPACNTNANFSPCSPIKVDIALTSTWKWKVSSIFRSGSIKKKYLFRVRFTSRKLNADYFGEVTYIKENLENMNSGNYSWKRISMIKQFLHGTKHRLNGIRLGLPKQESFFIYQWEFVRGYCFQDSCRPKFCDLLPHNSHRAQPNCHALCLRSH